MTLRNLAVSLLLLSLGASTPSDAPQPGLPLLLEARVLQLQMTAPAGAGRTILRTRFGDRTVYYLSPACCDLPSELYDASGRLICYPSGGFAGGDGRCPRFAFDPVTAIEVWRDPRARPAAASSTQR
jgi:hypothetical protein